MGVHAIARLENAVKAIGYTSDLAIVEGACAFHFQVKKIKTKKPNQLWEVRIEKLLFFS